MGSHSDTHRLPGIPVAEIQREIFTTARPVPLRDIQVRAPRERNAVIDSESRSDIDTSGMLVGGPRWNI